MSDDILVNIPFEDLPELSKMYQHHMDTAPQAYSIINTGIKWFKKKNDGLMTFMSPNNCWKEDGTFFVLMRLNSYDLFIFTLDITGRNVYNGITKTERLDFDRPLVFYLLHSNLHPIVHQAITDMKLEISTDNQYDIFCIKKEEAKKFKIRCPNDITIKSLNTSHAPLINSVWPHSFPGSDDYIRILIEMNGGYGVFIKSNNELVAWILKNALGQLVNLQTIEGHQKKGYASLMTMMLAKEIAEEGHHPLGTVAVANEASKNMFRKLGFESIGTCYYITLNKKYS